MPKQDLEFILGKDYEEPSSVIYICYEENNEIHAYRCYLNNLCISNPKFGLAFTQYGKIQEETYRSLETLIKICKPRNYELIKVESKDKVYDVFQERAYNFVKYLFKHYRENFKKAKLHLSTNWENLKRRTIVIDGGGT